METPPVLGYRDRSGWLVAFGIFEILLGLLCLLMTALLFASLAMATMRSAGQVQPRVTIPMAAVYVGAAAVLICLGIGSINARRWARALSACLSAIALAIGVLAVSAVWFVTANMAKLLPPNPAMDQNTEALVARVSAVGAILVMLVIIPGVLFLFYRSPNVRRTCEARNPAASWTDRCPLPVLALGLYLAFLASGNLMVLLYGGMFPLFGVYLFGWVGGLLGMVTAGIWLWLAWAIYSRRKGAWTGALIFSILVGVSYAATALHADYAEIASKMGMAGTQRAAMSRLGQLTAFKWMGAFSMVPLILWLLSLRRHFQGAPGHRQAETPEAAG
jgi:hypothetical protein